ncbi:hypothetical protein LPJ61_001508 [Coemansia biformis]|uniref:UDENN domain-containing protein n=1 Tax=Coemansia biformis TaxID=1286918 RepID=A0A9W7YGK6_9FUNG|nr:hypothetical protein LPJ61_001508 [Coemansia biformis]
MLPEHAAVEVDLPQVRRLLRKLLTKIADLEDVAPSEPAAHGRAAPRRCEPDGGGAVPPAHPFASTLLMQSRRQPRYTYKRRRCPSSGNSSESSDGEERARPRSPSPATLSSSEAASAGSDPARWLTTPRKRHRRRQSSVIPCALDAGAPASMATRSQSFNARLETLIVQTEQTSVNKFKAMYLLSHMVSLGETLWLCGSTKHTHGVVRMLPLRVAAAFRVGDAIASDSEGDELGYLDELYGAIPPLLVRFTLWQHAVSLCYRRIPEYADTLSEALWQVGAFAQQQWLIGSRLADLEQAGGLLRAASVAPLHLRAVDIGTEPQFVTSMLQRLASSGLCRSHGTLWRQFAPTGVPLHAAAASSGDEGGSSADGDGHSGYPSPTRYAKWVARISNTSQSVRVLCAALGQALALLSQPAGSSEQADAASHAAALEALHGICSMIYTKLSCASTVVASDSDEIACCLQQCLAQLAVLTGIGIPAAGQCASPAPCAAINEDIAAACLPHQTRLALLALRCRWLAAPAGAPLDDSAAPQAAMVRSLIDSLGNADQPAVAMGHASEIYASRRSVLVAHFNAMMEAAACARSRDTASPLAPRVLEWIVLPLSAAGASPTLLSEIAQATAGGLGKRRLAKAILRLTLSRFDAIWRRHRECSAWQHGWSELQTVWSTPTPGLGPADEAQMGAVQAQLQELLRELEERRQRHGRPPKDGALAPSPLQADVAIEDELGLLLSLRQHRATIRMQPAMLDASAASAKSPDSRDAHGANAQQHSRPVPGSGSSVFGDDEFHDCRSDTGAASASFETAQAPRAGASSGSTPRGPASPPRTPRLRSQTGAAAFGSRDAGDAPRDAPASTLRRSSTAKDRSHSGRLGGADAGQLVEARARRAIRAMAEACTTGVSVREADERRGRTFGRILAERSASSGAADQQSVRSVPMQIPLYNASLHGSAAELTAPGGNLGRTALGAGAGPAVGIARADTDVRARSLTDDTNAAAIARSASLEARVDQATRSGLARWVTCFGTVYFDVDQGPTLRLLYPHVPFSASERAAICFSAMPDSTIYELYDCVYTFNFRVDPARLGLPKDRVFLHGHVFFRQKRDPLMRRGGLQRAVVIISHLPYHGLFARLAHVLGPLYFDLGTSILEAAARDVASWPAPAPGAACELPFLGSALNAELPTRDASQLLETSKFPLDRFDPGEHILAGVSCDGLFRSFRDTLGDLWTCWELMILGEPLLVLADNPSRCSEAIMSLLDIIFPITYCGDYRPYFTIQDPDFRAIVSKTRVPPNTVVGVSNPFFGEALGHWPHKLFLGTSGRMSQMHGGAARRTVAANSGDGTKASTGSSTSAAAAAAAATGNNSSSNNWQGLQSKHRCAVSRDRPFVGQLLSALRTGKQTPWMINNTLRRYFIDLTVQFLAPLDRYFSTLMPAVRSATAVEPARGGPRSEPWAHAREHGASSPASGGGGGAAMSLAWLSPPGAPRPWRTGDFFASLESLGISPQLGGRSQAASAANVFASVFSGSSSSAGADAAGSSAGGRSHQGGRSHSGGIGGQPLRSSASAGRISAAAAAAAGPQPPFASWKSKRGSKSVGDEWLQLYTQFLKCGNFATWLAHRTSEAQRALLVRFRREVCQGDMHAWCRGFDHSLGLSEQQLAAEIEMLDLATMDLGQGQDRSAAQPHVRHVFYHGAAEDERAHAERRRRQLLQDQRARLAESDRPVYGSDGSLVGYARSGAPREPAQQQPAHADGTAAATAAATPRATHKRLGQRITHAGRAQQAVLQAAWIVAGLLDADALGQLAPDSRERSGGPAAAAAATVAAFGAEPSPPTAAERRGLLGQLSILLEYMAAETGRVFRPLVAGDYARAKG